MLAPQQVIVTQATPMVEDADDAKDGKPAALLRGTARQGTHPALPGITLILIYHGVRSATPKPS